MEDKLIVKEIKSRGLKDIERLKKIEQSREENYMPITMDSVITGLRFIAENPDIDQDELIDRLLDLGCNFSIDDINKLFPLEKTPTAEGMKKANMVTGAKIITSIRDNEPAREYFDDMLLKNDTDTSIYNFIRVATKDNTYTKANIEAKLKENELIR